MRKTADSNDRYAVITGGATGIGLAAATALAHRGFSLILCGRNGDALAKAATDLSNTTEVYPVVCDVSRPADVADMAKQAARLWGHVDVLFNNAGSGRAAGLEHTTDELWTETIGSSLTGTFLCCRELLPLLRRAPAPIIINNASVSAYRGFPGFAAYSAAKGGVAAFSRALREDLRSDQIRVSTLYAGATDSPFWDGLEGEWDRSRMMTCADVGGVIANLVDMAAGATLEEVYLMPAGGAL